MASSQRRYPQVREGYWFVPKAFGLGATPVTWQGWALTLALVGLLILDVRLAPGYVTKVALGIVVLAVFIPVMIARTYGGWRWRWGARD